MTTRRKKGCLAIILMFIIGVIVLWGISDRRPLDLKTLNTTFGVDISADAKTLYKIEKEPSFHGDGVSLYVYRLPKKDMKTLLRDLHGAFPVYSTSSTIGRTVDGDIKMAKTHAEDHYALGSLDQYDIYYVDRSPQMVGDMITNYEALLVNEKDSIVVYLVSDS